MPLFFLPFTSSQFICHPANAQQTGVHAAFSFTVIGLAQNMLQGWEMISICLTVTRFLSRRVWL
jgi:hypothetical protein